MSLVQESVVDLLNRRFVSCYYNAFRAVGFDPKADAFATELKKQGKSLQYGAIITPDGELISSFGYDMAGFYAALKAAVHDQPRYMWQTDEEKEVFRRAERNPHDADAQLAAARLHGDLLEFDAAQSGLDKFIAQSTDREARARAYYLKGHLRLLDLDDRDPEKVKAAFAKMPAAPKDLEDDVAMDLMSLDVELAPRESGFYKGWRFKKSRDLPATITALKRRIAETPSSNRVGQMRFYLGLALMQSGDKDAANACWKAHFSELPEDLYAMLSRLHHTDYQFSPYNAGASSVVISGGANLGSGGAISAAQLAKLLKNGGANLQFSSDGGEISEERKQELLQKLLDQLNSKGGPQQTKVSTSKSRHASPATTQPAKKDDKP